MVGCIGRAQALRVSAIASMLAIGLCGCAIIDQFGGRAATYNAATADAKTTTILLNIVRAAYSEPLQFTDVTTASGQTTSSISINSNIPIPANHPALIAARTATAQPSASASGTTTVNVANLNTQEFYYGLLSPLSMQQVAYYLSVYETLSPYQLLPLFISEIELTSSQGKKVVLKNRADSLSSFAAFYSAIDALVDAGLRVEPAKKKKPTKVGPILTAKDVNDAKLLPALVTASSTSDKGLTLKQTGGGFQLEKGGDDGGKYRFCFADENKPFEKLQTYSVLGRPVADPVVLGRARGRAITDFSVSIGKAHYCGADPDEDHSSSKPNQKVANGISLTTRSVEGIFHFLGEMVRTELGLGNIQASLAIPLSGESEFRLFRLERRPPLAGEPWLAYRGQVLSASVDPSGFGDGSSRVIQLLTDLLALQSSAKNLPAPNLITVAAPP